MVSENPDFLKLRFSLFLNMLALSLMMASNGCPPGLVLYQDQAIPKAFQDLQPLLSTTRSRSDMIKSTILTMTPYEHGDLFKSTTEFYEYGQFAKRASIRRMPLLVNVQEFSSHSVLFGLGIDGWWTKHQQILQVLSSRLSGLKEDYLDPSLLPDLMGHIVGTEFQFNRFVVEKGSLLQEAERDLLHDLPSTMSVHPDGQIPYLGNMADMKDLASVFAEFSVLKDVNQWRKQEMLVPYFRWNGAIKLRDHMCSSSLKLEAITAAPLKSPGKVKPKMAPKRKSKKAGRDRDLYKNNSLHACESLLSLMMDRKRDGKSVLSSLKKSGPELPQLLTQFSATITGTGLAVLFSVLYKVASGTTPFCTSNVLTSGFGIGLFWLSWAVNKLRNTILYIGKNSAKLGFEEDEMMRKVDKSVSDIFFRAAASMAVLMLRFA